MHHAIKSGNFNITLYPQGGFLERIVGVREY